MFISNQDFAKLFIEEYSDEIEKSLHAHYKSVNFDISKEEHKEGLRLAVNEIFGYYNHLMNNPNKMGRHIHLPLPNVANLRTAPVLLLLNILKYAKMLKGYFEKKGNNIESINDDFDFLCEDIDRFIFIADDEWLYMHYSTAQHRYRMRKTIKQIQEFYEANLEFFKEYIEKFNIETEYLVKVKHLIDNYDEIIQDRGK